MVSAGRLRPARKINQISQDVKCLVALGINSRFFAVSLRVTAADQIRICVGSSSFRVNFWRNAILLRLGQLPRIHDQLEIRFINRVECYPVNSRLLLIPCQTFFRASFFAQFIVLKLFFALIFV